MSDGDTVPIDSKPTGRLVTPIEKCMERIDALEHRFGHSVEDRSDLWTRLDRIERERPTWDDLRAVLVMIRGRDPAYYGVDFGDIDEGRNEMDRIAASRSVATPAMTIADMEELHRDLKQPVAKAPDEPPAVCHECSHDDTESVGFPGFCASKMCLCRQPFHNRKEQPSCPKQDQSPSVASESRASSAVPPSQDAAATIAAATTTATASMDSVRIDPAPSSAAELRDAIQAYNSAVVVGYEGDVYQMRTAGDAMKAAASRAVEEIAELRHQLDVAHEATRFRAVRAVEEKLRAEQAEEELQEAHRDLQMVRAERDEAVRLLSEERRHSDTIRANMGDTRLWMAGGPISLWCQEHDARRARHPDAAQGGG